MEEFTHIAGHVLEHSVADTLYLIPFLFVTYLVMEWLEHKTGGKAQAAVQRAGAAGPIVGAVVGVVPQCGFSAVAATLWAGRVITLGTLFAVFLSTSDEMLPIFIAEQVPFIFVITIVLNGVLEVVGEDALGEFLSANPVLSVFGSALVGLVPNCAASVVIAQLYVSGVLGSGAMLAGLLVSAGVGLLVLVRTNRHWKQNVAIIVGLYAMGVFWGLIANALGIVF